MLLSFLFYAFLAVESIARYGDVRTWEIVIALVLVWPIVLLIRDMAFFRWPYSILGGKVTSDWPDYEAPRASTPGFRDRPNFVAAGSIMSIAFSLSPWSSAGIHLALFRSGIGFSAFGKSAFIKSSSIQGISRISSAPRIFYIRHSCPEVKSPIGFSDEKFFSMANAFLRAGCDEKE